MRSGNGINTSNILNMEQKLTPYSGASSAMTRKAGHREIDEETGLEIQWSGVDCSYPVMAFVSFGIRPI